MNLNDMAVAISKYEGKKEQVNIAQIKEVLACIPLVYQEYINQNPEKETIPFFITKFVKKLTRDKLFVENVSIDDTDFKIVLLGKFENYNRSQYEKV